MGNTVSLSYSNEFRLDLYNDLTSIKVYKDNNPPTAEGCSPGFFYIRTYAVNSEASGLYSKRTVLNQESLRWPRRMTFVTQPLASFHPLGGIRLDQTVDLLGQPHRGRFGYLLNYGFTVAKASSEPQRIIPGELILETEGYYYIDATGKHSIKPDQVCLLCQYHYVEHLTLAEVKESYVNFLEKESRIDAVVARLQSPDRKLVQAINQAEQEWSQYRMTFQGDSPVLLPKLRLVFDDDEESLVVSPANFWPLVDMQLGIFAERGLIDETKEEVVVMLPEGIREVVDLKIAKLFFICLYQFRLPSMRELPEGDQLGRTIRGLYLLSGYFGIKYYTDFYQQAGGG